MSSTTSGMSTVAIILANKAAREARIARCETYMEGYEDSLATVANKQQYSACVQLIHPEDLSNSYKKGIAGCVLGALLIWIIISIILKKIDPYKDTVESIMEGFFSTLALLAGVGVIYGLVICVQWLFI